MLGNILKSVLGRRAPASGAPASRVYTGPRQSGFIGFVADVTDARFVGPAESVIADQASMRLRVGIPAAQLQRYAPVCVLPLDVIEHDPLLQSLGEPRAIVVGKFPVRLIGTEAARFSALVDWIETASRRHRVVADLSDDLAAAADMYRMPWLAEFQQRLGHVCALSVPSAALRDRVAADARHGVTVIEDPFERERGAPARFVPGDTVRLAWYGVFGPPLRDFIEAHFSNIARRLAPRRVDIAFVTATGQSGLVAEMGSSLRSANQNCELRFIPWSRDAVVRAVTQADLVILPQDSATDWGSVKSHNRLVEALRGGRFAIASAIPSYRELGEWAWVGEDLADGLEWALGNPGEVLQRITLGQSMVEQRFSPKRIGELWAELLGIEK